MSRVCWLGSRIRNSLRQQRLPLQKQTIALLDFYMKKCRPLLKGKPTDMRFLRTNGSEKGLCMVADLVKRTIRRRLDLDVNVHLFRHIGTMIYLEAHPGDFGVPRCQRRGNSDPPLTKSPK